MRKANIGTFIVIEGTDGSGKTEQVKRLLEKLKKNRRAVMMIDFPRYGNQSAYFVEEYLNGKYGGWEAVGPYQASLFYAMDRFAAKWEVEKALTAEKTVIANRYMSSNMGHQGAKIADPKKRRALYRWLYELEYGILGIPRPDKVIILHVPAKVSYKLILKKKEREYLKGKKRDIHEADIRHFRQAEAAYLELAKMFPKDFQIIECVENGSLLPPENIHKKVLHAVEAHLKI